MNIDEVIEKLKEFQNEHGNIAVRVGGNDEYWGTVYNDVDECTLTVHETHQLHLKKQKKTKQLFFVSDIMFNN